MAGIWPSQMMAFLPPSQYTILPLCIPSPTYSGFFSVIPLFHFFFQNAYPISLKVATATVCLEWTSGWRSGLVVPIVPYKYKCWISIRGILAISFAFFVDMKVTSLEHNIKPDDSLYEFTFILWEQSQRTDPGLWVNLTWKCPHYCQTISKFLYRWSFFFIADNMGIPYRGEQCPLSGWLALKFHRWREERKVSNP